MIKATRDPDWMFWLGALSRDNDSVLEVPELFGRPEKVEQRIAIITKALHGARQSCPASMAALSMSDEVGWVRAATAPTTRELT